MDDFSINEIYFSENIENEAAEIRVSAPEMNISKFRNILLYVISECGAKANFEKNLLNALLYFTDFDYYEVYEEHLTGATYKKVPYGPIPEKIDDILNNMIENSEIIKVETDSERKVMFRLLALQKPDLKMLKANEKVIIDNVIDKYADWNAEKLTEFARNDMPWKATDEGDIIDYELAFYRVEPFSARNYSD